MAQIKTTKQTGQSVDEFLDQGRYGSVKRLKTKAKES
jgi:hypothetical protein